MEYRLRYEFAHLGQTTSAGYDPTYVDYTDDIADPDNVVFTFGEDVQPDEVVNQITSIGFSRSVSGSLEASGLLSNYIRHWLIDHDDASINSLKVRITDVLCGANGKSLGVWQIVSDDLEWCDDGSCPLMFTMTEYTPISSCIQQTMIWDNHRNWFPDDGIPYGKTDSVTGLPISETHLHPRFRYCDDIKPQALQNFLFVIAQGIISGLFLMVSVILAIAVTIQDLINAVFGSGTASFADNLEDDITSQAATITQNLLGCGRMHPAPLVRNYFINACSKCMDENGARLQFESNVFNDPASPHARYYDETIFFAREVKGYRINEGNEATDYRDWIKENRPNETAVTLAHSLKDLFNAKFGLQNGVFFFHTKDYFPDVIIFDFTDPDDIALLSEPICYSWNAEKKYAATKLEYANDAQDQSGNEALHRYNGTYDWATDNPRYEGVKEIKAPLYGVARFANDGIDQKRIFSITAGSSFAEVMEWADDVLLLEKDVASLYKLLKWDADTPASDAVVSKVDISGYNISEWPNEWIYSNTGTLNPYHVFNNENFFFAGGTGLGLLPNLFQLHEIDDPTQSGLQNKSWDVILELCCSNLERLIDDDTLGDGVFAHLDYLIKLPPTGNGLEQRGNIKTVILDYRYNNTKIQLMGDIKYAG